MTQGLLIIGAYLTGSISPSVILGRVFRGMDLREHGSGNAGTANAFRVFGNKLGFAVLLLDIFKGFLPVFIAGELAGPTATVAAGLAAIAGHNWSVFLRGKGGKGVATGAGVLLAMMPLVFLIIAATFVVVLLSTSVVSLASLSAAAMLVPVVLAMNLPLPYVVFSLLAAAVVVYSHRGNIRRLIRRTESRTSLSWTALGHKVAQTVRARRGGS